MQFIGGQYSWLQITDGRVSSMVGGKRAQKPVATGSCGNWGAGLHPAEPPATAQHHHSLQSSPGVLRSHNAPTTVSLIAWNTVSKPRWNFRASSVARLPPHSSKGRMGEDHFTGTRLNGPPVRMPFASSQSAATEFRASGCQWA